MKKIISVILACLMLFTAFGCIALAADGYTAAYTVSLDGGSAERMTIVPVKYPVEKNEDDSLVTLDSFYVAEGGDFHFIAVPNGSYRFDQTTCIKAFPESLYVDIIEGNEYKADSPYGKIIEPDKEGVYTVSGIHEDTVIKVYNLQEDSLSDVKDFLLNFAQFFINLIKWFFGLF